MVVGLEPALRGRPATEPFTLGDMRYVLFILLSAAAGCQMEPQYQTHDIVGYWYPIGAAQFVEQDGTENHTLIAEILAENRIPVEFQYKGIAVPLFKADQAREVLLTDKRLRDRDIIVMFSVPAGTAEKRSDGFSIPDIRTSR